MAIGEPKEKPENGSNNTWTATPEREAEAQAAWEASDKEDGVVEGFGRKTDQWGFYTPDEVQKS